jgi:hypothetical protein
MRRLVLGILALGLLSTTADAQWVRVYRGYGVADHYKYGVFVSRAIRRGNTTKMYRPNGTAFATIHYYGSAAYRR